MKEIIIKICIYKLLSDYEGCLLSTPTITTILPKMLNYKSFKLPYHNEWGQNDALQEAMLCASLACQRLIIYLFCFV